LLDKVSPYIRNGNAGMDDVLYDVAYAACRDDEDWRDLAERFESLGAPIHPFFAPAGLLFIASIPPFTSLPRRPHPATQAAVFTDYWL